MNEHQLLDLKKEIDEANKTATELNGRRKQLMETLKTDWDCTSVDQAEKKAEKINGEIDRLNQQIKEGCNELEEKYLSDE